VAKKILTKLVADRLLSQDALDKFVLPVVPRTQEKFLKPFMTGEGFYPDFAVFYFV
jgi:hypothetical protein